MTAAAILTRLNDAGIAIRVEGDKLKLRGKVTKELLGEVAQVKPDIIRLLTATPLAAWRAKIAGLPSLRATSDIEALADYRMEKLRDTALTFLDGPLAQQAIDAGWDATQQFGINPDAPARRYGAWGLVVFLAWSASLDRSKASLSAVGGDCADRLD